jgi:hypothetical protein
LEVHQLPEIMLLAILEQYHILDNLTILLEWESAVAAGFQPRAEAGISLVEGLEELQEPNDEEHYYMGGVNGRAGPGA